MKNGKKPIKKLTERHLEAFNYYYSLGPDRTYRSVAEKFGVTTESVYNWASYFNWSEQLLKKIKEKQESALGESLGLIAKVRQSGIHVTDRIQEWTERLSQLHDKAVKEKRPLNTQEKVEREALVFAIDDFSLKKLKDLIAYFNMNVHFDEFIPGSDGEPKPKQPQIINKGPTLVMLGPGDGEQGPKKLMELTSAAGKGRQRLKGALYSEPEKPIPIGNSDTEEGRSAVTDWS